MKPDDIDHDGLTPLTPEEEARMQTEIDRAMEPYKKMAPASLLPILRERLEHALRTHPNPREWIRVLAPPAAVGKSDDVRRDGATPEAQKTPGNKGDA